MAIWENALFKPEAKLDIPAVAAKPIRAKISRYSTKPCADSSFLNRTRVFRINVIMGLFLFFVYSLRPRGEDAAGASYCPI